MVGRESVGSVVGVGGVGSVRRNEKISYLHHYRRWLLVLIPLAISGNSTELDGARVHILITVVYSQGWR